MHLGTASPTLCMQRHLVHSIICFATRFISNQETAFALVLCCSSKIASFRPNMSRQKGDDPPLSPSVSPARAAAESFLRASSLRKNPPESALTATTPPSQVTFEGDTEASAETLSTTASSLATPTHRWRPSPAPSSQASSEVRSFFYLLVPFVWYLSRAYFVNLLFNSLIHCRRKKAWQKWVT